MSGFWVHGLKFYRTDDIQYIQRVIKSDVHLLSQDLRMVARD